MPDKIEPNDITELKEKQKCYRRVFGSDDGKRVLDDLKRYCFIKTTTYNDHAIRMALNEGLRMAFLHIDNFINLDLEEIQKLQGGNDA